MKTKFLACLGFLAAFTRLAATPQEDQLIRLTDEVDAAIAARDEAKLKLLLNDDYTYVEPGHTYQSAGAAPAAPDSFAARIQRRLDRDHCWADEKPAVHVVGTTAVVTGTYRVIQRDRIAGNIPRLLLQGRFTDTWVKSGDTWQLLAEHRSLNDVLTWTAEAKEPPRPPPEKVVLPAAAASAAPPAAPGEKRRRREAAENEIATARAHRGFLPTTFSDLFRAYEPNQAGYTWDQDKDSFMDFTFSEMLPLTPAARNYPDPVRRWTNEKFSRPLNYTGFNPYFAVTVRAGQYLFTRPSAPVVGKRFNPLLALRFWAKDAQGQMESEDNFFELIYAHESNGQFIASKERFDEQLQVYLNQARDARTPAAADIARRSSYRSARDNISRGWDYVGVQFARDWDSRVWLPWTGERDVTMALRAKLNYYLPYGLLQHEWEQYNAWENDPQGKPRNRVDGLSLRYTFTFNPVPQAVDLTWLKRIFRPERRYSLTWTTGYINLFRYNTVKVEGSIVILNQFPLTIWYRLGYNGDQIDYYRRDHSFGLSLSYWNF